jgi:hypothetical protein
MPTHQQITAARQKAKRIREVAAAFRSERQLQRIAQIHPTHETEDVRLFVVKLPNAKTQRRAA